MADETNRPERVEPSLDLNPQTDRNPADANVDDMMSSLDTALEETFAAEAPDPSAVEEELRGEIATLKDQLLRSMAEVENVRRRVEREKQDSTKFAIANFAKAILPVADNLERALASAPEEARAANESLKNLCIGLEMTQNELRAAFERNGVKAIDAIGKKLDPNLHQAMFEVEDPNIVAGTVVQVIQGGYVLHDRLLRPAMVGVAKGGPKEAPAAANENPAGGPKKLDIEL